MKKISETGQHFYDLIPAERRRLAVAGLQALLRERTNAWNVAASVAAEAGSVAPDRAVFRIDEVAAELRAWGAAPMPS